MIQTRDNYLWLATDNGLVRFDGTRFRLFDSSHFPQLPFNEIRTLYEDTDGSIWIGTTRGVARYKLGQPAQLEHFPTFSGRSANAFLRDRGGKLWVGTDRELYTSERDGDFQVAENAPMGVRALCEDQDGTLWLGSNEGLFYREGSRYQQVFHERLPRVAPMNESVPTRRVNTIFCDHGGDLWIGNNRTLLHMRNRQFTSRGQELASQQVYDLLQTSDGTIYAAARFGVYRSIAGQRFEQVISEPSAFCLLEDQQGSLWVGHGDNRGLHRYRNSFLQTVWDDGQVNCVDVDSESNVWIGTDTGLYRLSEGGIDKYASDEGLPDPQVLTIARGSDKKLWLGTSRGLAQWTQHGIVTEGLPPELANMSIGVALEDSTGTLWLALGTERAFTLKDGRLHELDEFRSGRVHWFWEDAEGSIWIGHESGLFRHCDGKLSQVAEHELSVLQEPRFLCHVASSDGTLWMGTSNGIARYQSGRFDAFPPSCGLDADNVERLAVDEDENLWFGGRDGLYHASVRELDAFADGRIKNVTSYRLEEFDRFPPVRAFSQTSLARAGELWLVHGGLLKMQTKPYLVDHAPPSTHVESMVVDGVSKGFGDRFAYPSGKRRLAIHFAEDPFTNPRHVQIRYRLQPYDEQWIDASADRIAYYTDLRPGNYEFHLSSRHGNGPWAEAAHPPAFTVVPRWWETLLFRWGVVLLSVGLALSYGRFRIRKIHVANAALRREIISRQHAEEESRRHFDQLARVSRVASMGELVSSIAHEVKQPLFAILTDAETAIRLLDKNNPNIDQVRAALRVISVGGKRVTEIVDRIRSLSCSEIKHEDKIDVNQIVTSVLGFLEAELRGRDVRVSLQLAEELPTIFGNQIELQQAVMNLIINGAQAMESVDVASRLMSVATRVDHDSIDLSVCDCGSGLSGPEIKSVFEPFYTTKQGGMGMGLTISRTIIRNHGGKIWATANTDRGVTFHVTLPIIHRVESSK